MLEVVEAEVDPSDEGSVVVLGMDMSEGIDGWVETDGADDSVERLGAT